MTTTTPRELRTAARDLCDCPELLSAYQGTTDKDLFVEHHILDYMDVAADPATLDIVHDEIEKHVG